MLSFVDDDWGVRTVREVLQVTVHGGIERFRLHRSGAECVFDPQTAVKTGYREVRIAFAIDDDACRKLVLCHV